MDTPIALAARENHVEVVKFLSQFTDDPNAGNDQGKTPIHYAASPWCHKNIGTSNY